MRYTTMTNFALIAITQREPKPRSISIQHKESYVCIYCERRINRQKRHTQVYINFAIGLFGCRASEACAHLRPTVIAHVLPPPPNERETRDRTLSHTSLFFIGVINLDTNLLEMTFFVQFQCKHIEFISLSAEGIMKQIKKLKSTCSFAISEQCKKRRNIAKRQSHTLTHTHTTQKSIEFHEQRLN